MNSIPIFDSLTHPTLNGDWTLPKYQQKSRLKNLLLQMDQNNITKALAVGMNGIGGYNEEKYANYISSQTDKLFPIAFFNVNSLNSVSEINLHLKKLKQLGYKGIKLHPRIGDFNLTNKLLPEIIKLSNDNCLAVLLCTIFYSNKSNSHYNNSENLMALLENVPNEKIVLLHGGGVNLLEYMEIARSFKSTLLDLSFTIIKYTGSSIDLDIEYLFRNFDKRICIGSDFPELRLDSLRKQFNEFSSKISNERAHNIATNNLLNFFNFNF